MRLIPFGGLRPFRHKTAVRDLLAGITLASMNIPQVLGYARIAGMPVVTGLYTVLLPLVAFAVFGSYAILSLLPTRLQPSSSQVLSPAWRCPLARSTWRSLAWWRS